MNILLQALSPSTAVDRDNESFEHQMQYCEPRLTMVVEALSKGGVSVQIV